MTEMSHIAEVANHEAAGRATCRTRRCLGGALAVVAVAVGLLAWWLSADQGVPALPAERASVLLPGARSDEMPAAPARMASAAAQTLPGLDVMADKLAQRLAREPADGEGWALLARTYLELGKTAEADAAYARAIALRPDDAAMKADYTAARKALKSPPP